MPDDERPSRALELLAVGSQYHKVGNTDAARLHYDAALLLEPDNPIALQNLSGILFSSMQNWAALSVARRAMIAAPDNPFALHNHAAALMHLGQYARAKVEVENVLKTVKDDPGIWHNYSLILHMMGHPDAAVEMVNKALAFGPTQPLLSDLGIFTLSTGNIVRGLEAYEARWEKLFRSRVWHAGVPEWKGEDLSGKRVLLHHEQGFGDGIMLLRFAKQLRECGAEVETACAPGLIELFKQGFGIPAYDWNEPLPREFDYHTPMLSTLRWLGVEPNVIDASPYLHAPPWPDFLGPPARLKVGICWESGDHSPLLKSRRRVVPLEMFFPISELPGVRMVSLQKGPAQKDILGLGAESFIFDPMARVEDFYDTARIISSLDLVISVDSAVVHLAGALGKPTLMLGPFTRCWRWWGVTHGLPWYNNFKIFPQETYGDWIAPMKRVMNHLKWKLG